MKTIEITPPGDIPLDKQQQYKELKERYTILTQQQIRSDADREEMEELIRRAQELYSSTNP